MQTFLPSIDRTFKESIVVLDMKRLNSQCNESLLCFRTITGFYGKPVRWEHHIVSKMWKKYPEALAVYHCACVSQWNILVEEGRAKTKRDIKDEIKEILAGKESYTLPWWFGDRKIHSSHRSVLLGKFPEFYSQYGWKEDPAVPEVIKGRIKWPYSWPEIKEPKDE